MTVFYDVGLHLYILMHAPYTLKYYVYALSICLRPKTVASVFACESSDIYTSHDMKL